MIVYCTTNLVNSMKYIVQDSKNDPNYLGSGKDFKKALREFGKENFQKEILQYCINQEDLNEYEIYWVDYFNAVEHKQKLREATILYFKNKKNDSLD